MVVGRPLPETELVARAKEGGAARIRGARRARSGNRIPNRVPRHRRRVRCAGGRAGRVRQGLSRAGPVPGRRAVSGPGCSASSPTRPGTAAARPGAGRGSCCAPWRTRPRGTRPRPPRRRSSRRSGGRSCWPRWTAREDHGSSLACRYLLELSEEETGATLGVRRGTVKSRLARALEKLRAELGESGND